MAKKTVATLQTGKTDGRSYTKVIKMVKNPSGSYSFDELSKVNIIHPARVLDCPVDNACFVNSIRIPRLNQIVTVNLFLLLLIIIIFAILLVHIMLILHILYTH